MAFHMYVDESKTPNYLLMGVLIPEDQVVELRATMRLLLLPGQERIHFKNEGTGRRTLVLEALRRAPIRLVVVQSTGKGSETVVRGHCLAGLVEAAAALGVGRLILELNDTQMYSDKRALHAAARSSGLGLDFSYGWQRAREEPALWAADALAWAWSNKRGRPRWLAEKATVVESAR